MCRDWAAIVDSLRPSTKVCDVILAARCPSTKMEYTCCLRTFVAWCTDKHVDPLSAPLSQVILFILNLAQQGSASGTLKDYLSAISAFLRLPDQPSLFKSPIAHRFLQALPHMFLQTSFIMPQWDRNLFLTVLLCAPSEPLHNCPLRLLTINTAFLVVIPSAQRVSELQALSAHPPYFSIYPDNLVLQPRASFLPKVVTPFHIGQSIALPTFFCSASPF